MADEKTTKVYVLRDFWDDKGGRIAAIPNIPADGKIPAGSPTWDCPASLLKDAVNNGVLKLA